MSENPDSNLAKLVEHVKLTCGNGVPWSGTLSQIQKVYGIDQKFSLGELGKKLLKLHLGKVYLCVDLDDARSISIPGKEALDGLYGAKHQTLYVVPSDILWELDGEMYRRNMGPINFLSMDFQMVFVMFRNLESIQHGWDYTVFLELHYSG